MEGNTCILKKNFKKLKKKNLTDGLSLVEVTCGYCTISKENLY